MIKKCINKFLANSPVEHMTPHPESWWMKKIWEDHMGRYAFAAEKIKKESSVLDIACGEGFGSALLAPRVRRVTGVDISKQTIKEAQKKYGRLHKNLTFIIDDAFHFLENNQAPFDVILSFETIEHLKEYQRFLLLIKKNLKESSGLFILSTPNKLFSDLLAGGAFNPFHVKEFYAQELIKLLNDVFKSKPLLYLQRPIKKKHLFLGAVTNLLLNKNSSIMPADKEFEGLDMIIAVQA